MAAPEAPALRWLLDILTSTGDGADRAGSGHVHTDLAVLPSAARARFVVPGGAAPVAAASLTAYNALRPRRVAAQRAALAAAIRIGGDRVLRHHATVRTTAADGSDELAQRWLPEHLRGLLGVPRLHVAAGLSRHGPFAKPTLQLFGDDGAPLGYAKVGWNDATRAIVDREAEVLQGWPVAAEVLVPGLVHRGRWHDRVLSVSAPLPAGIRRLPRRCGACRDGASAVAAIEDRGRHPIGTAGWVRRSLDVVDGLADHPAAADARAARDGFEDRRHVMVPHGFAHGDWVRWNLAVDGARLVAWDWEHALDDAPLGFDLVHWAYQEHVVLRGRPPADGFARAPEDARRDLAALGLDPEQISAVAAAHRLHLVTREAAPAAGAP